MLKQSVEGRWSSVCKEWAKAHERLASIHEEWETKVRAVKTDLSTTAAQVGELDVIETTAAYGSKEWRDHKGLPWEWTQGGGYTAQSP
jgi:hypothetical protein